MDAAMSERVSGTRPCEFPAKSLFAIGDKCLVTGRIDKGIHAAAIEPGKFAAADEEPNVSDVSYRLLSSAWSKSAITSFAASMPTDTRTSPGAMPMRSASSALI